MTFLILLIALGVQWYTGMRLSLADFDWFGPYVAFLHKTLEKSGLWQGYVGLAVVVLPVLIAVSLVSMILDDRLFGAFEFLFSLAVFFYCVDGRSVQSQLASYFKGNKAEAEVKAFVGETLPKTDSGVARKVTGAIFTHTFDRVFTLIFWFTLLGPFGVALAFLVNVCAESELKDIKPMIDAARFVKGVLEWVPVRIAGLSFALMGSFGSVFVYWVKNLVTGVEKASELVTHYGLYALGANPREAKEADHQEGFAAAELVFRSVIVWLVIIGVVRLAAWF